MEPCSCLFGEVLTCVDPKTYEILSQQVIAHALERLAIFGSLLVGCSILIILLTRGILREGWGPWRGGALFGLALCFVLLVAITCAQPAFVNAPQYAVATEYINLFCPSPRW